MMFCFDSNIYVDATRVALEGERLRAFVTEVGEQIVLSSVVEAELEFGARTPAMKRNLADGLVGALKTWERVEAPTAEDWREAGRFLREHTEWVRTAAFQNDVLLAIQARRCGWIIISRDRDLQRIAEELDGLRVLAPFPERRRKP